MTNALAHATCKPVDISFPADTKFPELVPFEVGTSDARPGDRITIKEVRGTQKEFAKDGIYLVRGEYTLSSADEAVLGVNVTGGCTTGTDRGHVVVKASSCSSENACLLACLRVWRAHRALGSTRASAAHQDLKKGC